MAGLCFALLLVQCSGAADPEGTPRSVAREVERALQTVALNELARDPELATRLGLDEASSGYSHNRYLNDRSQAAYERTRIARLETRDVLTRLPRPAEASALARDLDTVIAAFETAETLFLPGHGTTGLGTTYPFAADHLRGAFVDVPELLSRHHPLNSRADAEAFLERLSQWPAAIESDRRRLEADARAGVLPPRPVLRRMRAASEEAASAPADASLVMLRFEEGLEGIRDLSIDERAEMTASAQRLFDRDVRPALSEFADSLAQLTLAAPAEPGLWQLPDGPMHYRAALAAHTGLTAEPSELHARGLHDVEALTGELDRALEEAGLTEGSVGQRLQQLARRPDQLYPDTEDGRTLLIERLMQHLRRADAVIESQIDLPRRQPVIITVTPEPFTTLATSASYVPATVNGSQPARFEINLIRMEDWPDFALATLVFHEAVPGHHIESIITATEPRLPLARRLIWNTGYGEGWATYAETLADEIGLYTDDPLGRIGYLQSMLLRSVRLVTDTGIHEMRWSREQAIAYIVAVTGLSPEAAADEVDRYSAWPAQASAYWIGRGHLLDLRERAMRVLGPDFDPVAFHNVVLGGGPRPAALVEDDVTRWYVSRLP